MAYNLSPTSTVRSISSKQFRKKSSEIQDLINQALEIFDAFGIPPEKTGRRNEAVAMAFIAVAGVTAPSSWQMAEDLDTPRALTTREIIIFANKYLGEERSSGSYDDVRRKDLKRLVEAGLVTNSAPESAHNSPKRGWGINPHFGEAIRSFGSEDWVKELNLAMAGYKTWSEKYSTIREMSRVKVRISDDAEITFGPGAHNELQKQIIEEFLPRYGYGAEVIYVADGENRSLHHDKERLNSLNVFELKHEQLPDVLAFSEAKDWLYVIEAVTSTGPISLQRHVAISELLADVKCEGVVYVTAFPNREKPFTSFLPEIAWETEVWVASDPDHLIHFNGERFLGPYPVRQPD